MLEDVVKSKELSNRRKEYTKGLRRYLERFFSDLYNRRVDEIYGYEIEERLNRITSGQSTYSRQTWLNRVSTFFSFAQRKGYIERNPCDGVERIVIDRKPPQILTVEQSRILLRCCPENMKPYLILSMFEGVRPTGELMRMNWNEINLETATVKVNHPKVRKHRRIIHLEPIAIKLLSECPNKTGSVAPSASTVRRWKRQARGVLGWQRWPQDILRHTAASYLLALHQNAAKVAMMLGNSVNILLTHYHDPVTKTDCEKFWKL